MVPFTEILISRFIMLWIGIIVCCLTVLANSDTNIPVFQIGPNDHLQIFYIPINTYQKYFIVVSFCFVNSAVRTLNHNILQPWIINIVQDQSNNTIVSYRNAYELSFVFTVYNWFDFFMYMNILIAQIDMLFIEIFSDLIMTSIVTTYFMNNKNKRILMNHNVNHLEPNAYIRF